jgi:hypothetical protein
VAALDAPSIKRGGKSATGDACKGRGAGKAKGKQRVTGSLRPLHFGAPHPMPPWRLWPLQPGVSSVSSFFNLSTPF